jgi:hypothetical protein
LNISLAIRHAGRIKAGNLLLKRIALTRRDGFVRAFLQIPDSGMDRGSCSIFIIKKEGSRFEKTDVSKRVFQEFEA